LGSGNDDLGRGSDDSDGEGSGSDDGEDKAMCIPFRTTPARVLWFKCPMCLREEYDFEPKVVLHAVEVIKQDAGSPNVVECHR
jgi:hypothetical protein